MVRNFGPNDRCELSIQSPPGIYAKPNERHIGELPTTLMCHLTMGRSSCASFLFLFGIIWHLSACSLLSDDRLELNHCHFDNFVVEQTNEDKNMPATKNLLRLLRTRFFGRVPWGKTFQSMIMPSPKSIQPAQQWCDMLQMVTNDAPQA